MSGPISTIIGAIIIAGAVLFAFRWEIAPAGSMVYRLDRWTGQIQVCNASVESQLQLTPRPADCGR
jgi:hypothetical protein